MLIVKNVSKIYETAGDKIFALEDFSYTFEKGNIYVISGPSGSGKTTLLNIAGGIDVPTSGSVFLNGNNIQKYKDKALSDYRFKEVGFIFQSFELVPVLNVYENIKLGATIGPKNLQLPQKQIEQNTESMIKKLGLERWRKHKPNQLSGGQKQRVAIARALAKKPSIILADEPTASLDSHNAELVIKTLKELNKEMNTICIISSHDKRVINMIDKNLILEDGKLIYG